MGLLSIAGRALGSIIGIVDKNVVDQDAREKLKAALQSEGLGLIAAELEAQKSIIVAEANGQGALQRNWRPVTMLFFVGLVGAHWLGFTPENLPETQVIALLEIVKIGLGGYVFGRSAEKVATAWKK